MLATTHEQRMVCDKCNKPGGVHLVSTKKTVFCCWIFAFVMCHALLLGACQHACHKYRKEMDVLAYIAGVSGSWTPAWLLQMTLRVLFLSNIGLRAIFQEDIVKSQY